MGMRVGCDLASVAEVAASIDRFGERYLKRVFTDVEIADCEGADRAARLAARFAAKEAVAKVLGDLDGPLSWRAITVRRTPSGRPAVALSGAAAELAAAAGIVDIDVSLAHEGGMALAVVLATGDRVPKTYELDHDQNDGGDPR